MSVISGVISRQVLPACGSLCFFCPSLRARSRQPVKRYKKLIANIFPRNQVCAFQVFCKFAPFFLTFDDQSWLMIVYVKGLIEFFPLLVHLHICYFIMQSCRWAKFSVRSIRINLIQ